MSGKQWPRDAYERAVWAARDLKPVPRLVALAFARSAGSSNPPRAWLTYDQMAAVTGAARSTCVLAVAFLVEQGWLRKISEPRGRVAPHYLLTQPTESRTVEQSESRTVAPAQPSDPQSQQSDPWPQQSDSRTLTVREPDPRDRSLLEEEVEVPAAPAALDVVASTSTSKPSPSSPHGCTAGWLDDPDEHTARPCLTCRPHLARIAQ